VLLVTLIALTVKRENSAAVVPVLARNALLALRESTVRTHWIAPARIPLVRTATKATGASLALPTALHVQLDARVKR